MPQMDCDQLRKSACETTIPAMFRVERGLRS